ncbi:MAG TPA: VTT domain-containing protein [Candidatus Acidoferrales bacterium]|nr:VTT domain-containing protein [Candidatus Acidoferrales bacterium]
MLAAALTANFSCLNGSLITCSVSYCGSASLFEKYSKYIGMKSSELEAAQQWFHKYGYTTIFFSRMPPRICAHSSMPAGIFKMDVKKFSIYMFI